MSTPAAQVLSGTTGSAASGTGSGAAGAAAGAGANAGAAAGAGAGAGAGTGAAAGGTAAFFDTWLPANEPTVKETREWLSNKGFKDPVALVTSYRESERAANDLRTAASLKGYPVETKDAAGNVVKPDENQVKAWRTAMGVPTTAADYKLELPANTAYPQFANYLSDVMLEAGVPAGMAPRLAKGYETAVAKLEGELRTQENLKSEADLKQLQAEWGPNYQERTALANRGAKLLFGDLNEVQMRTLEAVLGTSKFLTAAWKYGAGNQEASFPGKDGGGGTQFTSGTSDLQAQYKQNQADRSAGKIDTDTYRAREKALAEQIAGGFAATN